MIIAKKLMLYRALQGLVLSIGSPLGWLVIRGLSDVDLYQELNENAGVYWYMMLATATVFTSFGAYLGRKEQILSTMSLIDELTGLHNSRYFYERLNEAYAQSIRSDESLSLVMLDVDHFKKVNDTFGHLTGDKVLSNTAKALIASCRAGESASRVGGEEFCVILENCPEKKAVSAAERFRQAIAQVKVVLDSGEKVSVTVSAGVACSDKRNSNILETYRAADEAMYRAKQSGRDRTCI